MQRWRVNGEPGGTISPFDRGLAYGDGLFETIAVRDGRCRFWSEHMARLLSSCECLRIAPPTAAFLQREAAAVIAKDTCGTVKITVTRGAGARGYAPPPDARTTVIVAFQPEPMPISPADGIVARICTTRVGEHTGLAGMKTLNRLEQVLARQEWSDPAVAEGLMLNDRDELVGGTMSNVFLLRDGQLLTPSLDRAGVRGIMRAQVLSVAASQGLESRETVLSLAELDVADALFFTNSRVGILRVAQLGSRSFAPSGVLAALCAGLAERGVGECAA